MTKGAKIEPIRHCHIYIYIYLDVYTMNKHDKCIISYICKLLIGYKCSIPYEQNVKNTYIYVYVCMYVYIYIGICTLIRLCMYNIYIYTYTIIQFNMFHCSKSICLHFYTSVAAKIFCQALLFSPSLMEISGAHPQKATFPQERTKGLGLLTTIIPFSGLTVHSHDSHCRRLKPCRLDV